MITVDPKILEAVRRAAEENRRAGEWVASNPIPTFPCIKESGGEREDQSIRRHGRGRFLNE
jgi:hypothetical protein